MAEVHKSGGGWEVVYKGAINPDGSLLFPERLTYEFLENARRVMGSYIYSSQYENEVIPIGEQKFKAEWIRIKGTLELQDIPLLNFGFIDPAIGENKHNDYTALVVVSVDAAKNWYVRCANRYKTNPTGIVDLCFRATQEYNLQVLGVEDVAFQRSIIHFTIEEAKRRGVHLPITGVKRGPEQSKQMRILKLVPRYEWGTLWHCDKFHDLELELAKFPRGQFDDLVDALASIEDIVHYPVNRRRNNEAPPPNHPDYERWYRKQLFRRAGTEEENS